ncbi:hypothetical protein C8R46DRAFT_286865 [Mycena filopes]|nr:hypothetical protein C8R46DRAFT_286865 [Mycena filopes]
MMLQSSLDAPYFIRLQSDDAEGSPCTFDATRRYLHIACENSSTSFHCSARAFNSSETQCPIAFGWNSGLQDGSFYVHPALLLTRLGRCAVPETLITQDDDWPEGALAQAQGGVQDWGADKVLADIAEHTACCVPSYVIFLLFFRVLFRVYSKLTAVNL